MLRRMLLAASGSDRARQLITPRPHTRAIVARYVAGETAADAVQVTRQLLASGLLVSLDYLGEDTTDPEQAAAVAAEYIGLLGQLGRGRAGPGRGAEVSVKPTAVGLGLAEHGRTAAENISRICAAARDAGTTVTLDMEEHTPIEPTLRIVAELRAEFPDLGCVIQSWLRRSVADCARWPPRVAGAAVQGRLRRAGQRGVPRPARRGPQLRPLPAGADERPGLPDGGHPRPAADQIAAAQAELAGRAPDSFEYQMLYGIRPAEQRRLAGTGAQVRVYVPYGSDWYGYLVRRLAERPANLAFFLRSLAGIRSRRRLAHDRDPRCGQDGRGAHLRAAAGGPAAVRGGRRGPPAGRAAELRERYGSSVADAAAAAKSADTLILTVKPQDMGTLLDEIAPHVPADKLVISVAAGITTALIERRLARTCRWSGSCPTRRCWWTRR